MIHSGMRLFTLSAIFVLTACANTTQNVSKNYMLSNASGKGLAVGSLTSAGSFADYRIYYRNMANDKNGFFQLRVNDQSLNSTLIASELPAGDYEIYSWRVYTFTANNFITVFSPQTPFSLSFHVESGEAVYFGSCDFQIKVQFVPPWGDAMVACGDKSRRDLQHLADFYPGLAKAKVAIGGNLSYTSDGFRVVIPAIQ